MLAEMGIELGAFERGVDILCRNVGGMLHPLEIGKYTFYSRSALTIETKCKRMFETDSEKYKRYAVVSNGC